MALCKPAATELKSKNAHGLSQMQRSLFTDPFFDFFFWFIFWFWLYLDRTRGIVDGFCKCAALAFLRTRYVCKIIAYHTTIWITAAASGHACKSVYNPFASKNKGQKIRGQRLRVHRCDPWAFFDLRPVAVGSQDELWQGLSIFVF